MPSRRRRAKRAAETALTPREGQGAATRKRESAPSRRQLPHGGDRPQVLAPEQALQLFFRRGGATFLQKPYTRLDLAKAVRTALDQKSTE